MYFMGMKLIETSNSVHFKYNGECYFFENLEDAIEAIIYWRKS